MSLNKLSIIGYVLFIISIILFFFPKQTEVRNVVHIQREIHRIQTIRKEQTKETDSKIEVVRKKASARISNIKELDFNKEIISVGGDSVCVENSQLEQCLEYKIKFERDSVSLMLMTEDRDSCNAQFDTIVSKIDTLVIESKKNEDVQYRRGLLHGIVSGVVVTSAAIVTLLLLTK
jgi:hypothetical protein